MILCVDGWPDGAACNDWKEQGRQGTGSMKISQVKEQGQTGEATRVGLGIYRRHEGLEKVWKRVREESGIGNWKAHGAFHGRV